jgi:hypothetical protein
VKRRLLLCPTCGVRRYHTIRIEHSLEFDSYRCSKGHMRRVPWSLTRKVSEQLKRVMEPAIREALFR